MMHTAALRSPLVGYTTLLSKPGAFFLAKMLNKTRVLQIFLRIERRCEGELLTNVYNYQASKNIFSVLCFTDCNTKAKLGL
jgi:hypothetical protein